MYCRVMVSVCMINNINIRRDHEIIQIRKCIGSQKRWLDLIFIPN